LILTYFDTVTKISASSLSLPLSAGGSIIASVAARKEEKEIEIADDHVVDHAAREPSESTTETERDIESDIESGTETGTETGTAMAPELGHSMSHAEATVEDQLLTSPRICAFGSFLHEPSRKRSLTSRRHSVLHWPPSFPTKSLEILHEK
jgi:hypothetical protein